MILYIKLNAKVKELVIMESPNSLDFIAVLIQLVKVVD